jgi:hypothetical protein
MPDAEIPIVTIVVNGPVLAGARDGLGMSRGKQWSMGFQLCERLVDEIQAEGLDAERKLFYEWREHTTTIARVALTANIWQRVQDEAPGCMLRDEGFTEVAPDSEIAWVVWPCMPADSPRILSNAKCPLLGDDTSRELAAFMAGWDEHPDREVTEFASRDLEEQHVRGAFRDWRSGAHVA